jgi:hypothetical protein
VCDYKITEFAALSKLLPTEEGTVAAAMDCTEAGPQTCSDMAVDGYPTLILFSDATGAGRRYNGQRFADDMLQFIREAEDSNLSEQLGISPSFSFFHFFF